MCCNAVWWRHADYQLVLMKPELWRTHTQPLISDLVPSERIHYQKGDHLITSYHQNVFTIRKVIISTITLYHQNMDAVSTVILHGPVPVQLPTEFQTDIISDQDVKTQGCKWTSWERRNQQMRKTFQQKHLFHIHGLKWPLDARTYRILAGNVLLVCNIWVNGVLRNLITSALVVGLWLINLLLQ